MPPAGPWTAKSGGRVWAGRSGPRGGAWKLLSLQVPPREGALLRVCPHPAFVGPAVSGRLSGVQIRRLESPRH